MLNLFLKLSLQKPRLVYLGLLILTLGCCALIPSIKIDTDPENMLAQSEPARITHNQVKETFQLYDLIVVGAVAKDEQTIFNQQSLSESHRLVEQILTIDGVIHPELNSLSTIDNISQLTPGTIRFEWMMPEAPADDESVRHIATSSQRLPMIMDSLVSGDLKATAIYVPIADKNESYRISQEILAEIEKLPGHNQYFVTGLPVAEDTFGVEMFIQMGISAPLAAAVIYLLMLYFFRSPSLVAAPMYVAMATVLIVMGCMIGMGYTVHIMSSMIPIFLMPIAVVDSVHLMSEFVDHYKPGAVAKDQIRKVTKTLYRPMLFTSITSSAGFFSLALTPIPPVQVFGMFVGFGILLAFLITMLLIPAYISRMSHEQLASMQQKLFQEQQQDTLLAKWLPKVGAASIRYAKPVLVLSLLIIGVSLAGIQRIQINDNPVRWFKQDHPIRIADRVLNDHFAGTYDAHLVLRQDNSAQIVADWQLQVSDLLEAMPLAAQVTEKIKADILNVDSASSIESFNLQLEDLSFDGFIGEAELTALLDASEPFVALSKPFTHPDTLAYMERLQAHLKQTGLVGKSNSVLDLVKTLNRELLSGDEKDYQIPRSQNATAQVLLQFQSSHRPKDLWHFVTPDYQKAQIWLQLTSGDNQDMQLVLDAVDAYIAENPLPAGMQAEWAGKAYLNLVWQDKMVAGMFDSLTSAFVIVLLMMVLLFRSLAFGLLAMLPLTLTILFMYGMIGWSGKYYDMPIAVLSALTLGLSVDFAIHFIERMRAIYGETKSWNKSIALMFEEPARAITRNALVIALGFTPLLFAPLVPYITVGVFLALIMAISALVTLVLLPAMMATFKRFLFK